MKRVRLDRIEYDPKYYPRVNGKEDWLTVFQYKEALESDASLADPKANKKAFPPIILVAMPGKAGWFILLDGLHRIKAFAAAGFDHIYAEIERLPKSKWFARSVELNMRPSRGLDPGDKAWVAQRLEADGWKIEDVANLLKMKVESLEKIKITRCQKIKVKEAKKMPLSRSNRAVNGNHFGFLKAPFKDLVGTQKGTAALKRQASISSRTVLQVLDAAIAVLESGVIDTSDEQVADKLEQLTKAVAKYEPVVV